MRITDAKLQTQISDLRAENTELRAEVVNLQAEHTDNEALLNAVVLQVNKLSLVSTLLFFVV